MDLDSHCIEICKANTGAIRFQVKSHSGCAQLYLSGINPPHKDLFDVLCGYNATWVKTGSNKIPQNAFIGGISEVRKEPLYIGRAVHDGSLIIGKIHVIYHTCYLPYQGKEVEKYNHFEVLVLPDQNYRGILGVPEFDM